MIEYEQAKKNEIKFFININQLAYDQAGLAGRLDIDEIALLDYVYDFELCEKAVKYDNYTWIDYETACNQLIFTKFKSISTLSRSVDKLKNLGLLDKIRVDRKVYLKTTALNLSIIASAQSSVLSMKAGVASGHATVTTQQTNIHYKHNKLTKVKNYDNEFSNKTEEGNCSCLINSTSIRTLMFPKNWQNRDFLETILNDLICEDADAVIAFTVYAHAKGSIKKTVADYVNALTRKAKNGKLVKTLLPSVLQSKAIECAKIKPIAPIKSRDAVNSDSTVSDPRKTNSSAVIRQEHLVAAKRATAGH